MKKFVKVMMVIAAVFTAVGIGLSVGGVAMGATLESVEVVQKMRSHWGDWTDHMWSNGHWRVTRVTDWDDDDDDDDDEDWDDNWDNDYTEYFSGNGSTKTYDIQAASELEIDLKYDELIFREYDGDKIRVDVENDSANNIKIESKGGKLKIKSEKKKNNRSITVSYPEKSVFSKVDIEVDAGTVEMMDRLETDKLEVSIGAGEFTNSDSIIAREASIEVGTGEADIMQLTADKIDGECGVGNMTLELTGKESDYSYKLECGIGDISIDGDSFTALASDKKINNSGATKYMELECGMGNISVEFSDADE